MRPNGFDAGMISHPTSVLHCEENVEAGFVALVGVVLVRIARRHGTENVITDTSEKRPGYL